MQKINKKGLLLALIFAVGSALFVFSYINRIKNIKPDVEYVDVVFAVKTIDRKAVIAAGDVKTIKTPKENINPRAVFNVDDIVGKRVKESIIEGEQLLKDRILYEEKVELSFEIPEGKRAVSVNVNEATSVGNFIRPGDYVDILATFDKYEVEEGAVKKVVKKNTKTILQNIMILGIGQLMEIPEKQDAELPKTVTFAVSADEAEKLVYGEEAGVLRMSLRRSGDKGEVRTLGVIGEDLVAEKSMTR